MLKCLRVLSLSGFVDIDTLSHKTSHDNSFVVSPFEQSLTFQQQESEQNSQSTNIMANTVKILVSNAGRSFLF